MSRMPARCCRPIQLHFAKLVLTKEEMDRYRAKYEEWLTPNPLYCPVPTCSAFIPQRLLPEHTMTSTERFDSGVATPTSNTLPCPTCETDICRDCRQVAHPNSACTVTEFGIDKETTELLKSWGYKQCPKCKNGIKRMYGCNHIECRCGARFCYVCFGDPDDCAGNCVDEEDHDGESDDGSVPDDTNTTSVPSGETSNAQDEEQNNETHGVHAATSVRPRNLDGGRWSYWEAQNLDFGEEPNDERIDISWTCSHHFESCKTTFADALVGDPSAAARDCVKCWREVYPEIALPHGIPETEDKTIFTGPRAASTHTACSPLSQSVPERGPWSMQDNTPSASGRVLDIYRTVVSGAASKKQRRASMDDIFTLEMEDQTSSKLEMDFAHECIWCSMFFCTSCRDVCAARRDAERRGEEERE